MKNLDDKIKNAFEQKEIQIDRLDLWQGIEKELPEEKKDRKFFIWFLFGGLIIIIGLLLNHYLGSIQNSDTTPKTGIEKQAKIDNINDDSNTEKISSSTTNPDLNYEVDANASILSDDENLDKNNNQQATSLSSKTPPKELETLPLKSNNSKKGVSLDLPKTVVGNPTIKVTKILPMQSEALTKSKDGMTIESPQMVVENLILKEEPTQTTPLSLFSSTIPFIKVLSTQMVTSPRIDTTIIPTGVMSSLTKRPYSNWSAKLYTNYLNLNRSFSGNNQNYFDEKKSSERARYAYHTGALINFALNPKITLGIGIDYSVQEEVINWSGVIEDTEVPFQSDSAFFFNYFQKTYFVAGTNTLTEIRTRRLRKYNRIQQWSIPIEINYTAIQKGRLKFHLTGGAKFNLSNRLEGKYLGPTNEIKEGDEIYSLYKRSKVHTWYGGLGIAFNLTSKLSIQSDFRYQSSFNILQDELDLALRYRGYSIGLGLVRRF